MNSTHLPEPSTGNRSPVPPHRKSVPDPLVLQVQDGVLVPDDGEGGLAMGEARGGMGFWSGFRFGIGFVLALMLMTAVTGGMALGAAWWVFGSVQGFVTAGARAVGSQTTAATRALADGAASGIAGARDRAVAGVGAVAGQVGETTRKAGEAVSEKGAAVGARASEARDAVTGRVTGWADRLRGRQPASERVDPKPEGTPVQGEPATATP
jgi:hypothetical protein